MTYVSFKPYSELTEEECKEYHKEFYAQNGPKPDYYDFQDFIEDDRFNLY